MATGEALIVMVLMIIGMIFLYLAWKRKAVMWGILSTVLFLVLIIYSMTIPFNEQIINGEIQNVGSTTNIVLAGIFMMFGFISLIFSFKLGMEFFK